MLTGILVVLMNIMSVVNDDAGCASLGRLDLERAEAYARADPAALLRVYASAEAGAHDVGILEAYRARGLRIEGAVMVRESCRTVARDPGRIDLAVIERLGPATVVGRGVDQVLPFDGNEHRRIALQRSDGRWRIASSSGPS